MYKLLLPFLFLIITLFSCQESKVLEQTSFPIQNSDTIMFDVGFAHKAKSFVYKNKTYVYLFDLQTYKRVKLYDEKLKWIKTFNVDTYSDGGLYLADMEMITPDSLLLLTDHHENLLISVNLKTEKVSTVHLNSLVKYSNERIPLIFNSSFFSHFTFKDGVVLSTVPNPNGVNQVLGSSDPIEGMKIYDSINKALPVFTIISNPFNNKLKVKNIERSQAFRDALKGSYLYNQVNFFISNNVFIYTSGNLSFLDVYYLKNGKTKAVKLESKYASFSVPYRKWEDIDLEPTVLYNSLPMKDLKNAGKVIRIIEDRKNKYYHVFLEYPSSQYKKHDFDLKPFIWQIYDKDFNLIDEQEHKLLNLDPLEAFATDSNLYIPHYNENTYDPTQAIWIRYSF